MKRIRFSIKNIEKINAGKKTMTYRLTVRKKGDYIVEEGGHPYFKHIDTGVRITILRDYNVPDIELYAHQFFRREGFESPQAFLAEIMEIYGALPKHGWGHRFEIKGAGSG